MMIELVQQGVKREHLFVNGQGKVQLNLQHRILRWVQDIALRIP